MELATEDVAARRAIGEAVASAWAAALPSGSPPLAIPGAHNRTNAALAASAVATALAARDEVVLRRAAGAMADFAGLPHRLQLVLERAGVRCYDDSKCTTPAATELAVAAFDDAARVHLVAGGYDKGVDLSPIARLAGRVAGLYAIGTTGPSIAGAAAHDRATKCETLERAVRCAAPRLRPGDVLLLSPGCASWDQFENYESRGREFKRLVEELVG